MSQGGYYSTKHRVPHHLFAFVFAVLAGLLLYFFLPISGGLKEVIVWFAVLEGGMRICRAVCRIISKLGTHSNKATVHFVEVIWLGVGVLASSSFLLGDMFFLLAGLAAVRASGQIFPIIDHVRSMILAAQKRAQEEDRRAYHQAREDQGMGRVSGS